MFALLRHVQQTVAGQLGHGVALVDVDAVLHEVVQDLRVEDGGRAAQVPQAVQLFLIAAADLVVDHLHQHRRGGHCVAVHHGHIAAHVARVRAEVQGPALDAVGEVADEAGQVEHGHQREVAEGLIHLLRGHFGHDLLAVDVHLNGGEVVFLAEHDTLAAAGGAGSEQQHQQLVGVDAVFQGGGCAALVGVHGAELVAVSGLQLLGVAVVDAVGEDQGGLAEAQLIFQLRPSLLLVQGHDDGPGHHGAEGHDAVLIIGATQDRDPLALEIGNICLQIAGHLPDVGHERAVGLLLHGGGGVVHPAERRAGSKLLLHGSDHIINRHGHLFFRNHGTALFSGHLLHTPYSFGVPRPPPNFSGSTAFVSQYTARRVQMQVLIAQICNLNLRSTCAGRWDLLPFVAQGRRLWYTLHSLGGFFCSARFH